MWRKTKLAECLLIVSMGVLFGLAFVGLYHLMFIVVSELYNAVYTAAG